MSDNSSNSGVFKLVALLFQLLVELHEHLILLHLHVVFGERFLGGRIDRLSRQQVKPGQMERASDLLSNEESGRKVSFFMRAGPVPCVKLSIQIHNQNPSTLVLDSLHSPWWKLRDWADGDERSQNLYPYRYL